LASRALHQVAQEWLVGVNRMNDRVDLLGEGNRLPTRPAAGVDNAAKVSFRKEAEDAEGVIVGTWTKLFHAAEEQADRIGRTHDAR
jgi:hypothetical protein